MTFVNFNKANSRGGNASKVRLLDEKGEYFMIDVSGLTLVYDRDPNSIIRIRRIEVQVDIVYPRLWSSSQGLELVTLNPGSQEYKLTIDCFTQAGLTPNSVKKKDEKN